jgi:hypothetical protein
LGIIAILHKKGSGIKPGTVQSLIAAGYTRKQAAGVMNVKANTVGTNIFRIREKYAAVGREARTKLLLHIRAQEDGLIIPHRQ